MKFYDKILFGIALIALGVSVFLFATGKIGNVSTEAVDVPPGSTLELSAYNDIDPPEEVVWEEPLSQDPTNEKWLFQVFTPPRLYLVDGRLVPDPPVKEVEVVVEEKEPFGVWFADIRREKYRLQLDAVYEFEQGNMETARAVFANVYGTQTEPPTVALSKGETNQLKEFRLIDLKKLVERDKMGGTSIIFEATIEDLRTGQIFILSNQETLFSPKVDFIFESTIEEGVSATITAPGETFEMNDATYTVADIDLEAKTATLVKSAGRLDVDERETLSLGVRPARKIDSFSPTRDVSDIETSDAPESGDEALENLF